MSKDEVFFFFSGQNVTRPPPRLVRRGVRRVTLWLRLQGVARLRARPGGRVTPCFAPYGLRKLPFALLIIHNHFITITYQHLQVL
jgi:hypothetical protein